MKNIIGTILMVSGMVCGFSKASAQEIKEKLTREFAVTGNGSSCTLFIYNISGFIKVEGYDGNKVMIEMDKTISADDSKTLETGKKEFRLAFDEKSDTIMVYIAEPFDSRPRRNRMFDNNRQDIDYNFNVNFTVKVPYAVNLHISTVNDGIIQVNNVGGALHVNNVNDEISIRNARGATYAHTVNGDVSVSYLANPKEESSYYTINGNIKVTYQPDLSADLQFKSMHGDFFTDFTDAQRLPAASSKIQEKNGGGTVYKLNSVTAVRFGKGGKKFKFETLNGNVYIKKQS